MSWILLAAGAQFLSAIVALLDKYIVSDEKMLPRPFVYAFYTCLIAGLWIFLYILGLIPFLAGLGMPTFTNIEWPTFDVVFLSLFAGFTFFIALIGMFTALKKADTSDVIPVIGAVSAIGSFVLGYFFLGAALTQNFIIAFILLALGTFFVSQLRFSFRVVLYAISSGLLFGAHYVAIKALFMLTSFDNGFFWSRAGFVVVALIVLLIPHYFRIITERTKRAGKRVGGVIFVNKVLAGISAIMILKATDWGDVAVVQALGGLQFVFILAIGMLMGHTTPSSCGEESCRRKEVIHKALSISIITLGFLVLFI